MNTKLNLDKAGRIVIPKQLRDELQLQPGDALELESQGDQITLRPVRSSSPLVKEHGVWVFRAGQTLTAAATEEVLQKVRETRDQANQGRHL
jgi:AbrB family looped-hinge helix DNA binding protein